MAQQQRNRRPRSRTQTNGMPPKKRYLFLKDWKFWTAALPLAGAVFSFIYTEMKGYVTHPKHTTLEVTTWEARKKTYTELVTLTGKIGSASVNRNDSLLIAYKKDFDVLYFGPMKSDGNDRLALPLMQVQRNLQDAIDHNLDDHHPEILQTSCLELADSVKQVIEEGDKKLAE